MSKITVLYPVLHYPPVIGGLEQWEQNIAERQPDDVKVIVVTGRVSDTPNYENRDRVLVSRTSPFILKDFSHSSPLYITTTFLSVLFYSLRLARKHNVDMFHCHGFVSAFMGCILSWISGRPFIGTEQSLGWVGGPTKYLRRAVYKRAALCIASSGAVADEFRKLGVKRIEVIPNGVDVAAFRDLRKLPQDKEEFEKEIAYKILAVGRLEKVKGFTYLIDAFRNTKQEIPRAKLEIVGDGTEREALERQAKNLGIYDSVRFVGEVSHDALPKYFKWANVFVMPSLSEGFGITAIEAMAAGIPVVASAVGGLLDIVENGKTGILVEPKNPEAISHAVIRLRNDHNYRDSLTRNAEDDLAKYNWDVIAIRVSEIYKHYGQR